MKAIEVLAESKRVTEAPAGMIGQGLKRIGSKLAGAVGMKNAAGALAGSADLGARANEYSQDFRRFLARKGKNINSAEYSDVMGFLSQNGLPATNISGTGPVGSDTIDKIFLNVAQQSFGAPSTATSTGGGAPATGAPTGAAAPVAPTPAAGGSPSGSPAAPSGTPTAPAGSPAAPSGGPKMKVSQLVQAINALSPKARAKLMTQIQTPAQPTQATPATATPKTKTKTASPVAQPAVSAPAAAQATATPPATATPANQTAAQRRAGQPLKKLTPSKLAAAKANLAQQTAPVASTAVPAPANQTAAQRRAGQPLRQVDPAKAAAAKAKMNPAPQGPNYDQYDTPTYQRQGKAAPTTTPVDTKSPQKQAALLTPKGKRATAPKAAPKKQKAALLTSKAK